MIGYIAKDKDDDLYLYDEKPEYDISYDMWCCIDGGYIAINKDTKLYEEFTDLSYLDEPIEVEIKVERKLEINIKRL